MRSPTTLAILFGGLLSLDTVACGHDSESVAPESEMVGSLLGRESVRSARVRAMDPDGGVPPGPILRSFGGSPGGQVFLVEGCTRGGTGPCISLVPSFTDAALRSLKIEIQLPRAAGSFALDDLGASVCEDVYDESGDVTDCTPIHGTLEVKTVDATCDKDHGPCTSLDADVHIELQDSDGPAFYGDAHLHAEEHLYEGSGGGGGSCGFGKPGDL